MLYALKIVMVFEGMFLLYIPLSFFSPFPFLAGEDDYAIDIFSFGICALEVRETDMNKSYISVFFLLFVWVLTDYLYL